MDRKKGGQEEKVENRAKEQNGEQRTLSKGKKVKEAVLIIMQYSTIQYNTIQYNTIQYSTIQHNTLHYTTLHYTTIQYNTTQ